MFQGDTCTVSVMVTETADHSMPWQHGWSEYPQACAVPSGDPGLTASLSSPSLPGLVLGILAWLAPHLGQMQKIPQIPRDEILRL